MAEIENAPQQAPKENKVIKPWADELPGIPSGFLQDNQHSFREIEFSQGGYGDCQTCAPWHGIDHLPGGEEHLKKMVRYDPNDQSYHVKFPGYDKEIIISKDDPFLKNNASVISSTRPELAPMLPIMEAAWLHVAHDTNSVPDPFKLLLGENTPVYGFAGSQLGNPVLAEITSQTQNYVMVGGVGKNPDGTNNPIVVNTLDGQSIEMPTSHAYDIRIQGNEVLVSNPHDTSHPFRISMDQAGKVFQHIEVAPGPGGAFHFQPGHQAAANAAANFGNAIGHAMAQYGPFSLPGHKPAPNAQADSAQSAATAALETLNHELAALPQSGPSPAPPQPSPAPQPGPPPSPTNGTNTVIANLNAVRNKTGLEFHQNAQTGEVYADLSMAQYNALTRQLAGEKRASLAGVEFELSTNPTTGQPTLVVKNMDKLAAHPELTYPYQDNAQVIGSLVNGGAPPNPAPPPHPVPGPGPNPGPNNTPAQVVADLNSARTGLNFQLQPQDGNVYATLTPQQLQTLQSKLKPGETSFSLAGVRFELDPLGRPILKVTNMNELTANHGLVEQFQHNAQAVSAVFNGASRSVNAAALQSPDGGTQQGANNRRGRYAVLENGAEDRRETLPAHIHSEKLTSTLPHKGHLKIVASTLPADGHLDIPQTMPNDHGPAQIAASTLPPAAGSANGMETKPAYINTAGETKPAYINTAMETKPAHIEGSKINLAQQQPRKTTNPVV